MLLTYNRNSSVDSQASEAQNSTLHTWCMGQLVCIENCMGKSPIVKKCVNNYTSNVWRTCLLCRF